MNWTRFLPAPVIGVDEVGRGCLAGPVVAAAVILSRPQKKIFLDSKVLAENRRDELLEMVMAEHQSALGFASEVEIDQLNIFHASLLAMRRAVEALSLKTSGHVLVDGKFTIPHLLGFQQSAFIRGDARVEPISAASIVAKVTRDRLMKKLAATYPEYGFEVHKGYPTLQHRTVLAKVGPCAIHRRSFRGVEAY